MLWLKSVLSRLSDFHLHMLIQSGGTVVSQLIPIAVSPLVARLFSPVDFGLYGLVVSISTLLALVITLRLDHGVIVAEIDEDAKKIATLSVFLAVAGAALFSIAAFTAIVVLGVSSNEHLMIWVIFSPAIAMLSAILRTLTLLNNRFKSFSLITRMRIAQAIVVASASLAFGYAGMHSYGMILALLMGNILYICGLARPLFPLSRFGWTTSRSLFRDNSRFIKFSLPADLVNSLSSNLPFMLFPALFGLEQTGYLALAYRVVATPSRFVGSAIGEVFYSHAAREYQATGTCWPSARNVMFLLGILGTAGFLALFLLAGPLFTLVFGPQWHVSAEFTRILTPMLLVNFVVSPLSVVFYIASRQATDLAWQVAFLTMSVISSFSGLWLGGIYAALIAFSAGGSVLYVIYFLLIRRYAKRSL